MTQFFWASGALISISEHTCELNIHVDLSVLFIRVGFHTLHILQRYICLRFALSARVDCHTQLSTSIHILVTITSWDLLKRKIYQKKI